MNTGDFKTNKTINFMLRFILSAVVFNWILYKNKATILGIDFISVIFITSYIFLTNKTIDKSIHSENMIRKIVLSIIIVILFIFFSENLSNSIRNLLIIINLKQYHNFVISIILALLLVSVEEVFYFIVSKYSK